MKKFGKILVSVLSLALALGAFVFTVSADDAPFLVEGLHRNNWAEAIDNAGDGVPVQLLTDYTVSEGESVVITKSVTIDLNGYKIKNSNSEPLFVIGGKDVELTIAGPGSIVSAGTLVKVDGEGSSLVISGGEGGISIETTDDTVLFELGGTNKGSMRVEGSVNVKTKANTVFASLVSASKLEFNNATFKFIGNEGATGNVALIGAGSKVVSVRSNIYTEIGTMFSVLGPSDIGTPAVISAEYSTLTVNSSDWGTVIDAADEYLTATIRVSEVRASGAAFVAADTMRNVVSGEGASKVYQAPKASVYLTNSTYGVASAVQAGACLYSGNITGVVSGGTIEITKNEFVINTRLWDGANGIFIKRGTKVVGDLSNEEKIDKLKKTFTSGLAKPGEDADKTVIYFDPNNTNNKNFSLEDINGKTSEFYVETKINSEHEAETYLILGTPPEYSYVIDTEFSSNFQSHALTYFHSGKGGANAARPVANGLTDRYGAVMVVDSSDGSNRYMKYEYSQEDYKAKLYPLTNASYVGLFLGSGTQKNCQIRPTIEDDFITVDFDISTDSQFPDATLDLMQRPGNSVQYQKTANLSISGNQFKGGVGADGKVALYTLPETIGEWTHITFLLQIDNSKNTDKNGEVVSYNLSKSVLYTYVNGEYLGKTGVFDAKADTSTASVAERLALDELRFAFLSLSNINAEVEDSSLCLDNLVVTHYKKGYEGDINKIIGNGKSLFEASDVIFGKDYQFPTPNINVEPNPLMIVDDVMFDNVENGLAAISEGSVVELFTDVEGTYKASVSFTVHKNGNRFDVTSDTHYIAPVYGEVDVIKVSKSNNYVPVYWDVDDFSNKNNPNSFYSEMNVPFGIIPYYNKTVTAEGVEVEGLWREFIGWSYTKGASTPDELRPITKEDVDRGYVCLYPVYAFTKTKITFLDVEGQPIGDPCWVPIGTPIEELINYKDGEGMPSYSVPGVSWYKLVFSGWTLDGTTDTEVGAKLYTASPVFEKPVAIAIKQGFSLLRLTRLIGTVYIESPEGVDGIEIIGIYSDSDCTVSISTATVTISGKKYVSANMSKDTVGFRVDELATQTCFIKFSFNGTEYVQSVKADLESYLEALLTGEGRSDKEKAVAIEMLRFVSKSYEMLGKDPSDLCNKYLNDTTYTSMLRDLTTVNQLFSAVEKDAAQYEYIDFKGLGFDYASNSMYIIPLNDYYPITDGYNQKAWFIQVYVDSTSQNRVSVGITGSNGKYILPLNNDGNGVLKINIDSYFHIIQYDPTNNAKDENGNYRIGKYRWANYITYLESAPNADANELEYARIIYSMHYSIKDATGQLNLAPPVN